MLSWNRCRSPLGQRVRLATGSAAARLWLCTLSAPPCVLRGLSSPSHTFPVRTRQSPELPGACYRFCPFFPREGSSQMCPSREARVSFPGKPQLPAPPPREPRGTSGSSRQASLSEEAEAQAPANKHPGAFCYFGKFNGTGTRRLQTVQKGSRQLSLKQNKAKLIKTIKLPGHEERKKFLRIVSKNIF